MRKTMLAAAFILLSFSVHAGERNGQAEVTHCGGVYDGARVIITENKVNVRSSPGMDGEVVGQLNAGDIVTISEVCEEKMFVDGAWANWVLLDVPGEPCYALSRWMTAYFIDLENPSLKICDSLAYEFFCIMPDEPSEPLVVRDNFIRIRQTHKKSKFKYLDYPTFVPENNGDSFIPPQMSLTPHLDDLLDSEKEPMVLFRQNYKYHDGYFSNVRFYRLFKEGFGICVEANAISNTNGEYSRVHINFENACYDVLKDKWVQHTSDKAGKGTVIVTKEKLEYKNGEKIITKEEYNPEL